ncbi:THUMP domain-containing protein 1-like protein isoform X2 [Iris pallida]|uniref:THUMP domain-containing protein 1-like protein isoform X2 n=1 Tax=Iris pallida TaxID=29817 RepID=A0AAX6GRS9_IRIPA|nr:THUMP domain-containing protein 1-like protein isoform X2 [Iris pallida]
MAADDQPNSNRNNAASNKGKKRKFLPHGKPVRKGLYPLKPGVQGFFITCDGGRERQASNEAISLLDTFYEELVFGKDSTKSKTVPSKPMNKITKFEDSDSSGDEDEDDSRQKEEAEEKEVVDEHAEKSEATPEKSEDTPEKSEDTPKKSEDTPEQSEDTPEKSEDTPAKKRRLEADAPTSDTTYCGKSKDKSIDDLIEDELKEMGDRNKRHFVSLDSGCNGCIFIQMHKSAGDPGPASIVQHMMNSAASTRKHMSRFILRVVPAEVTCYTSEEEISKAIKPLIEQHFPTEAPCPQKFAVLFEARAHTGIDRMKIINAVAKSVPQPHKVDLNKPDKTIIVQVAKTICMIGVVEKYKELSKYNLRQLTTPQQ